MRARRLHLLLLILTFTVLAVTLSACSLFGTDSDDDSTPVTPTPEEFTFFSTDGIIYNDDYSNPDAPDEKGYLIYDSINLDGLSFEMDKLYSTPSISVDVFYDGALSRGNLSAGQYSRYQFEKSGEYTFKVYARKKDKTTAQGSFSVNVQTGGRPTEIRVAYSDADGNAVTSPTGGTTTTATASLYSETLRTTHLTPIWKDGTEAFSTTLTYPNLIAGKRDSIYVSVDIPVLNSLEGNYTLTKYYVIDVRDSLKRTEDCPSGISVNLPDSLVDGSASVTAKSPIFYALTATAHFLDGSSREITSTTSADTVGRLRANVKYNGDTSFKSYVPSEYNYEFGSNGRVLNYYRNGETYYFDHTKTSAQMNFEVVTATDSSKYVSVPVTGVVANLNFSSLTAQNLHVTKLTGERRNVISPSSFTTPTSYTNYPSSGGIKSLEDYSITDFTGGEADVYICCDLNRDGKITDDYSYASMNYYPQYFKLEVDADSGAKDYTVTVSDSSVITHYFYNRKIGEIEYLHRYFVPLKEGSATITLTPKCGGTPYVLTVNVINPVLSSTISTGGLDDVYYSNLDSSVRRKLVVEEYRYNLNRNYTSSYPEYGYSRRSVKDEEKIKFAKGNLLFDAEDLDFATFLENGNTYTLRLSDADDKLIDSESVDVFILPDFYYSLDGGTTKTAIYAADYSYKTRKITSTNVAKDFDGAYLTATVAVPDFDAVTEESLTFYAADGSTFGSNVRVVYSSYTDKFILSYDYLVGSRYYRVEFALIELVQA